MKLLNKFKEDSIPLIIGIAFLIISLFMELFTNYGINEKHILGGIALAISFYTYLNDKKIYFYSFTITLILGLFDFIDFLFLKFNISFGFGDFFIININPIFIFLLVLLFLLNKKK